MLYLLSEMRNILKVTCIYIATIIGAGFASGREIIQFFTVYHSGGFYGIIMTGLLFAFIGYTVLNKVYSDRIRNYEEYLFPSVGWVLGWIMEVVVTLFMVSVFCIMISGMSGIVSDKFNIPFQHTIMYVTCICMIFFLLGIRSIVSLSTFITPILIAGILGIGLYIIIGNNTSVFNVTEGFGNITQNWFVSSILYVSYNSIISVVVMCSLLPYLKTKKTASIGGIMGGAILCAIVIVLNYVLYIFYPYVTSHELPVIGILDMYGELAGKLYRIVLLLAMFISALTAGYGFIERISSKVKISRKIIIPIICCLTAPISTVGFSKLISFVYPVFGYLGMFMVFIILLQGFNSIFKTRWRSM